MKRFLKNPSKSEQAEIIRFVERVPSLLRAARKNRLPTVIEALETVNRQPYMPTVHQMRAIEGMCAVMAADVEVEKEGCTNEE